MKKKFNRGFSFVELLAAIVIMGLLSGLAIVSIRFLLNKAEKEYYKAQESEIIMAAKSYTQDNRNHLPKRVGLKTQIFLSTLQEKKYIGDVVDRSKKKCFPDQSYVQVYRYDKNHYNYVVNLVCNSYKSMDNDDSNITEKPTVKINFLNVSKNDKYSDAKVNLVIEDDNKISSYSYIIVKDGEEVKNSGDIDGKLQTKIDTNISLADYVPGKITVKAVATNTLGNQGNDSKSVTVKNENAPTCEFVRDNSVKDVNGNPTCEGKWIKDPTQATVEAQVKCIDKSGSGCQKDVYTQVFFGERKTDTILIKDNTGNTNNCSVYVCIDVTKPTTPVIDNPYEGIWINKSYSIKISSYDKTAGIAYFEYRYPDSTGVDGNGVSEKEWHQWANSSKNPGDTTPFVTTPFSKERDEYVEVRACDRAGNCSDIARSKIRIDKTDPTCTITKNKANPDGLNDWYVTNVNLTLNRNDVNGSGDRAVNSPISYELKKTNSASYNGTTTGTQKDTKGITWYGFIKDEAGNKTTCKDKKFKVDATKPTMKFTIDGETAVVKCSDEMSGLKTGTDSEKTQKLTGTKNITVSFICTDNAGNVNDSSHTYKYNSCKSTINTCSYGCGPWDDCYTGSPSVCVGGNYSCNCSNCKTGSSRVCVGGYVKSTCEKEECKWHGGSTAHGDYRCETVKYSCDKWSNCATTKNTCQYGCDTCYDSCLTTKNTCQGGQYCSNCYYGDPRTCVGGFQLN